MTLGDVEIWLGTVGSGASTSVSITLSGAANGGAVADICEYSGIAATSYLDQDQLQHAVPVQALAQDRQALQLNLLNCG